MSSVSNPSDLSNAIHQHQLNMSAMVMPQPGMPSIIDSLNPPSSFSARKSSGPGQIPGRIELPINPVTAKFGGASASMVPQMQSSISNLLTPPSNIPGESLSPMSSNPGNAHGPASHGLPPFTPNGSWHGPSGTGLTPLMGSGTGNTPHSWGASLSFPPPRSTFSPMNSLMRNGGTPVSSGSLPPPPYDFSQNTLPPFSAPAVSMPPIGTYSAMQAQQAQYAPNSQSYIPLNNIPLTAAAVNNIPTQSNPISPTDAYLRAPPTPASSYYGSQTSGTPAQPAFSFAQSPPALSPPPRISPITSSSSSSFPPPPSMSSAPLSFTPSRPFSYPLPGAPNMHPLQPQNHAHGMSMPHTSHHQHQPQYPFNSGTAVHMSHLYNSQHHAMAQAERPFKCDQCPQSFNRNHDLKRHKRIHLAVKPFPCGYCDKSFSRKDALKRHVLVKGCGKAAADAIKKEGAADADMADVDADSIKSESEDGDVPPASA